MAGIFVSYRRRDRPIATRFLVAKLNQHYGTDQVFHDLADIDIGDHFLDTIKRALDHSAVLIAIIGRDWLAGYRERLHQPDDPVRLEISTALNRGVLVLPVLIAGATMPEPKDLPPDMLELHYKNAVPLRSADFDADINRLISRLDRIPQLKEAAAREGMRRQPQPEPANISKQEEAANRELTAMDACPTVSLQHWTADAEPSGFELQDKTTQRSVELQGSRVTLTRACLDPNNPALSSRAHALVEFDGAQWSILNLSSNGATFVQISREYPLQHDDRLVFGSAIFQFDSENPYAGDGQEATVALDQLQAYGRSSATGRFRLRDPKGETHDFEGPEVIIRRERVSPGNTSISRHGHARLCWRDDRWLITDLSSNGATFVQARRAMPLADGCALILGDKLYSFHPTAGS